MDSISAISVGLGVFVGMMMALTGAGGGILSVPLLVFGLNLSVAGAGPIGLLAIAVAGSLGAINGLRTKLLRYRAALVMAGLGIVLAPIGVYLAQRIPNQPLMIAFAVVLIVVSIRMLMHSRRSSHNHLLHAACHALLLQSPQGACLHARTTLRQARHRTHSLRCVLLHSRNACGTRLHIGVRHSRQGVSVCVLPGW
jgi:uncharacterized membrane protein YfcA